MNDKYKSCFIISIILILILKVLFKVNISFDLICVYVLLSLMTLFKTDLRENLTIVSVSEEESEVMGSIYNDGTLTVSNANIKNLILQGPGVSFINGIYGNISMSNATTVGGNLFTNGTCTLSGNAHYGNQISLRNHNIITENSLFFMRVSHGNSDSDPYFWDQSKFQGGLVPLVNNTQYVGNTNAAKLYMTWVSDSF